MIALPTAKILLFIALTVGPHNPPMIFATSNSDNYVWGPTSIGWTLVAKGFPASDFTRDPSRAYDFTGSPRNSVPSYLRVISRYDWSRNSTLVFDNGDRVEKRGDHAFYIVNAGGPNEKIFTILFPGSCKS